MSTSRYWSLVILLSAAKFPVYSEADFKLVLHTTVSGHT